MDLTKYIKSDFDSNDVFDLFRLIHENLKLPSYDDFKILNKKDENFCFLLEKYNSKIYDNYGKYQLRLFALFYLKALDDFFDESIENDNDMSKSQFKWYKNDFLKFFNNLEQDFLFDDEKKIKNLFLIIDLTKSMFNKGKKYDKITFVYESLYQLDSRSKQKRILKISKNTEFSLKTEYKTPYIPIKSKEKIKKDKYDIFIQQKEPINIEFKKGVM